MSLEIPQGMDFEANPETNSEILPLILEGEICPIPGNCSAIEYFQYGLSAGKFSSEQMAIIRDEVSLSFGELNKLSNQIAQSIDEKITGLKNENPDGDLVIGVCMGPSEKLVLTLFAIWKVGGAYVPFDQSFPEDRVKRVCEGAKPQMIICDNQSNILEKFDGVKGQNLLVLSFEDLSNSNNSEKFDLKNQNPENTAIILYTSGSSGEPKGVRLNHRTVMNRLFWQWVRFPYIDEEVCCFKTALTFVDSVPEIFGPLLRGYPLVIFNKTITSQPNILLQKLKFYQITRLVLVPSLLRAIFYTIKLIGEVEGRESLKSLKLWICSGETLPISLLQEFFTFFPKDTSLCNFYGSTEIMGDVTFEVFSNPQDVQDRTIDDSVPIGASVFNTQIYILDKNMGLTEKGQIGEIFVSGFNLASGYVGIRDSDKFLENPYNSINGFNILYRTGDFGHIGVLKDGSRSLFYDGRLDSQIKVRGHRVDLNEIQANLNKIDGLIEKSFVLCYQPGGIDQAIVAFIVLKNEVVVKAVEAILPEKFREYEIPELFQLTELPLLINGKVDRQRLLREYAQKKADESEFENWQDIDFKPEDKEKAQKFIEIMSKVTGISVQDILADLDNSFYNLGGNSLNSVVVILKLRQIGYFIEISQFVGAKSIREIVNFLTNELKFKSDSTCLTQSQYQVQILNETHKHDVKAIIASSFSHKGDLEKYTNATYEEFEKMIESIYPMLVEKNLSCIIKRVENDQVIAASLQFDFYDEPEEIELSKGIGYALELLDHIESSQRSKLPQGKGKLLHSFMMGTLDNLSESENVHLIELMEKSALNIGQERNYVGVVTTNTNPLTQQMALVNGYEELFNYQANEFISKDGTKPFRLAPDEHRAICSWKKFQ